MVHDVTGFLARHAPFSDLDADALAAVAMAAEIEFRPRGEVFLTQGAAPAAHVWVVRSGTVELLDEGRVLDQLGPGEMVGHPSMLSGMPAGFEARVHEDALLYRLPAAAVASVLTGPAGVRFVARTLLERARAAGVEDDLAFGADTGHLPIGGLVRRAPVVCAPGTAIRDAARRMTDAGVTALVVDQGSGRFGVVTDRDLRTRVATGEVGVDAAVEAVMTPDAHTVTPDRIASEVLIELLEMGVRHAPVVDAAGTVVGVLDDRDLLETETRAPFRLRRAIAMASSPAEVAGAARGIPAMTAALMDSRLAPARISAISAVFVDALTRRLIDLAIADIGAPPVPFSWLMLGSMGRREAMPSSDADTGLLWHGEDTPEVREWMAELAGRVMSGLEACGVPADANGVRADRPLFARSAADWRQAVKGWIDDPLQDKALIAISVLFDGRIIWGEGAGRPLAPELLPGALRPQLIRLLARLALAHRPPTGFRGALVVEHTGLHAGTLDIKRGGVLPIADLARWAAAAAGAPAGSTADRLRAGIAAGTLGEQDGRSLAEAWELVVNLRLEHQAEQLRAGVEPDDRLDPGALNQLTRRYLREAFRAVAGAQRRVANQLTFRTGS